MSTTPPQTQKNDNFKFIAIIALIAVLAFLGYRYLKKAKRPHGKKQYIPCVTVPSLPDPVPKPEPTPPPTPAPEPQPEQEEIPYIGGN
ncbi:MAG: hypothetical protein FWE56_03500 [Candidatus Bathyarchaeota archaeon]|nr:hypothetical protein [Candidatus Termiticorpusculum sp.]